MKNVISLDDRSERSISVYLACVLIALAVVMGGLMMRHKLTKLVPPDVIKTMDKTISDDATGYRFAHLTTVVVDGKTGEIKLLSTQMLPLPKLPKQIVTEVENES